MTSGLEDMSKSTAHKEVGWKLERHQINGWGTYVWRPTGFHRFLRWHIRHTTSHKHVSNVSMFYDLGMPRYSPLKMTENGNIVICLPMTIFENAIYQQLLQIESWNCQKPLICICSFHSGHWKYNLRRVRNSPGSVPRNGPYPKHNCSHQGF